MTIVNLYVKKLQLPLFYYLYRKNDDFSHVFEKTIVLSLINYINLIIILGLNK